MKIIKQKVEKLKEYVNNTKEHPEDQISQIAKSIQEFGFNDPIAVDKDNVIIEGHGRFLAAQKLGMTEVPVIKLDHLTDIQKKAYIIAHNKLNLSTGFNAEKLESEYQTILESNTGYEKFTFLDEVDLDFGELLQGEELNASGLNEITDEELESMGGDLDGFARGDVRKVTLYFDNENYTEVMDKINVVMLATNTNNPTEMFLELINEKIHNDNLDSE